ncbi:MAG TPA: glycosyltransferase family 1 protein [Planctomycetota bacterium]
MKVLLEGFRLARQQDTGGVDSYWRKLLPRLLDQAGDDVQFKILSAFLKPSRARALEPYRRAGAVLRHWWAAPQWLEAAGRIGLRAEWLAGGHDLVHAVEPVWKLRGRARVVVTLHDLMYHHCPQFLDPRWVARLENGTIELARRAAYWICVSAHSRDDLVREFSIPRGRTAVVHHGVDASFHSAGDDPASAADARGQLGLGARPYLLFLGSVEPKKNLGVLLDAYGAALERGLQADLVVAGRAGWRSELVTNAAAAAPALRERVRFLGFVDQDLLPGLVAGARALVLPSRYEGFGMPVLEAMAAGTPVLCSHRGALPEVAGGAARLFDPDDDDGLAGLLQEIDQDAALRDTLRAAGRERARPFTWERCAGETLQAYRNALELPA